MILEISYGYGGAPMWHVTAPPEVSWHLKISRQDDASQAFRSFDGRGEERDQLPQEPGTYWLFLYNSKMQFDMKISHTVPAPTPPPPPPPIPSPTPPPGVKVVNLGPIGSSCTYWGQGENGNFYYKATDYLGADVTPWNKDQEYVLGKADRDARCHVSPDIVAGQSPATKNDLASGLSQLKVELDANILQMGSWLSSIFSDTSNTIVEYLEGMINGLVAGLRSEISALSDALTSGLQQTSETLRNEFSALVDPIWSALSEMQAAAEEESQAWRKGILGIEDRLKSWISGSIFELLMKNLNGAAIEYKKQRGKT